MSEEVMLNVENITAEESLPDDDMRKQMEIWDKQHKSSSESPSVRVKIQPVPNSLYLRDGRHLYTTREISIGLIHARNKKLKQQNLKHLLAKRFMEKTERTSRNWHYLVGRNLNVIKNCYQMSVVRPFNDDELRKLLLIDACFVLQFIYCMAKGSLNEFEINSGLQNSIQHDLFLVDNQLPWCLLDLIIKGSISKQCSSLLWCLSKFMDVNAITPTLPGEYKVEHFLNSHHLPIHLLDLLRMKSLSPYEKQSNISDCPRSFRNVQDLKLAGIKIKPNVDFYDVSFSRWWFFSATLTLPILIVDKSTESKLLNLLAYEMCPDNHECDSRVSSYLYLMDSLVDTEQDVRDLRDTHVLRNRLSSDNEVATLINRIGSYLITTDAYMDVQAKIQKHYESHKARWWAQFSEDYFSSPWKVLALIGGMLVLFFGGVSAYFTVFPRKGGN